MRHIVLFLSLLFITSAVYSQETWVKVFGGSFNEYCHSVTLCGEEGYILTVGRESYDGDVVIDDYKCLNTFDKLLVILNRNGEVVLKGVAETVSLPGVLTSSSHFGLFNQENGDGRVSPGWRLEYENLTGKAVVTKGATDIYLHRKAYDTLDRSSLQYRVKVIGGSGVEAYYDVLSPSDGGLIVLGSSNSNDGDFVGMNKGQRDVFIVKVTSDLQVVWCRMYGGSGNDIPCSLVECPDGGFVITGTTDSNDGDFKAMHKGRNDVFLMKLDREGMLKTGER